MGDVWPASDGGLRVWVVDGCVTSGAGCTGWLDDGWLVGWVIGETQATGVAIVCVLMLDV